MHYNDDSFFHSSQLQKVRVARAGDPIVSRVPAKELSVVFLVRGPAPTAHDVTTIVSFYRLATLHLAVKCRLQEKTAAIIRSVSGGRGT